MPFSHKIEDPNSRYHIIGHSQLKLIQHNSHPDPNSIAINWHYRGGAKIWDCIKEAERILKENYGKDLIIILHCLQNDIRRVPDIEIEAVFVYIRKILQEHKRNNDLIKQILFSECAITPEHIGENLGDRILKQNKEVTAFNTESGVPHALKPWKVGTKV